MNHGDIISAWQGRVFFIYESELQGGFIQAADFSTSTYLLTGTFAQDQMYHKTVCTPATEEEKQEYNKIIQNSKFKQHILQTELI